MIINLLLMYLFLSTFSFFLNLMFLYYKLGVFLWGTIVIYLLMGVEFLLCLGWLGLLLNLVGTLILLMYYWYSLGHMGDSNIERFLMLMLMFVVYTMLACSGSVLWPAQ